MKKIILFLAMLLPMAASAYDFMVDGVAYKVLSATDLTCVVTEGCVPDNGKLVIPATVNYKNRTLTVVGIGEGKPVATQTVTDLTIENGPTYIEATAFASSRIQTVRIPPSIKLIKSDGFGSNMGHNNGLATWISEPFDLVIEDGEDVLKGEYPTFFPAPFYRCMITRLYLGRSIDDELFTSFSSVENFTIGDMVTSVASEGAEISYYMSSLKKLTVGKKLEVVPNLQEESIDEIYMRSETPPLSEGFKDGTYVSATLYVPRGTKEVYENAPTWQNFWTIEEYDVKDNDPNRSAYAEYDSSTATLTFKYGVKPNGDNVYDTENTHFDNTNPAPWPNNSLKKVVFDESYSEARPKSTASWFLGATNLTSISGMEYLNTSEVTDMNFMFCTCLNLYQLDLSHFNTENVTSMFQMLSFCNNIKEFDLSSFNTSNVTQMGYMFYGSANLTTIFVGDNWSTVKVTNGANMFQDCTKLVGGSGTKFDSEHIGLDYAHVDGGSANPGYLTKYEDIEDYAIFDSETGTLTFKCGLKPDGDNVYATTYDMAEYKKIYGAGFISPWYEKHNDLKTVIFDQSYSKARPKSIYRWFLAAKNLTVIRGMENLNTSEVVNMSSLFEACSSITVIDLSHFNTVNVTDMSGMFGDCSNLKTIYVGDQWSTEKVTSSSYMFDGCTSLVGGAGTVFNSGHIDHTYAHIDGGEANPGYLTKYEERTAYAEFDSASGTLTFKYGVKPNGDNVYDTEDTNFDHNTAAPWVSNDLKYVVFDKSYSEARPTSTAHWFDGASNLWSIKGIENLNTSEVTNMTRMFLGCLNLSYLDLSHFNTEKVWTMNSMFGVCENLVQLDLSSFNTSNVIDMAYMFSACSKLIKLNLSSFNTEKTVSMMLMFNGCSYLTQLDLRNFNTTNVTRMESMFSNCGKLRAIYVGDKWSTAKVTNGENMFIGCSKLSGSAGTKYDNEHNNFDYARVDGGTDSPGYLSLAGEGSLPGTYAITDKEAGTLTFKYGPVPEGKNVTWLDDDADVYWTYYKWEEGDGFYSPWHEGRGIKTIVFDKSYAVARPQFTYMWFAYFKDLISVEGMENFNASELKNMSQMFYNCTGLTELNLSSLNTSNVRDMSYLFSGCSSLKTIYVGDQWSTASVTDGKKMFKDCTSLVGGAGTVFDSDHVGVEYAHIDGGTENPGYFSMRAGLKFDVNLDGKLDAKDIVDLTDFIAGKSPKGVTTTSADVNGDNVVNIADVIMVANNILTK